MPAEKQLLTIGAPEEEEVPSSPSRGGRERNEGELDERGDPMPTRSLRGREKLFSRPEVRRDDVHLK